MARACRQNEILHRWHSVDREQQHQLLRNETGSERGEEEDEVCTMECIVRVHIRFILLVHIANKMQPNT